MAIFVGAMNSWVECPHVATHEAGGDAPVTALCPFIFDRYISRR